MNRLGAVIAVVVGLVHEGWVWLRGEDRNPTIPLSEGPYEPRRPTMSRRQAVLRARAFRVWWMVARWVLCPLGHHWEVTVIDKAEFTAVSGNGMAAHIIERHHECGRCHKPLG